MRRCAAATLFCIEYKNVSHFPSECYIVSDAVARRHRVRMNAHIYLVAIYFPCARRTIDLRLEMKTEFEMKIEILKIFALTESKSQSCCAAEI